MRELNRLDDIKRRIEWPVLIGAITGVLLLGTIGCTDGALTGPEASVLVDKAAAEQNAEQNLDAAGKAAERQRDKNARSNGQAAQE